MIGLGTAFTSRAYPINPHGPTEAPAGYVTPTTFTNNPTPPLDMEALQALRGHFVETILRSIILAIRNFLGIDLPSEQLSQFFTNLASFLAEIDFFDGAFNPIDAWINFLETLFPWFDFENGLLGGVLDGINLTPGAILDLIREMIGEALQDIPLLGDITFPIIGKLGHLDDMIDEIERHFTNLRSLLGVGIEELLGAIDDFNPVDIITNFLEGRLFPAGLQDIFEGVIGTGFSTVAEFIENFATFFSNLRSIFSIDNVIDLLDDFDLPTIILRFLDNSLLPHGLQDLFDSVVDLAQDVINTILEAINGIVPSGGGLLSDLFDAVGDLFNTANDGVSQSSNALGDIADLQDDVADIQADIAAIWRSAPATSSSSGTTNQLATDGSFLYVCTATNTWKRTALSTW